MPWILEKSASVFVGAQMNAPIDLPYMEEGEWFWQDPLEWVDSEFYYDGGRNRKLVIRATGYATWYSPNYYSFPEGQYPSDLNNNNHEWVPSEVNMTPVEQDQAWAAWNIPRHSLAVVLRPLSHSWNNQNSWNLTDSLYPCRLREYKYDDLQDEIGTDQGEVWLAFNDNFYDDNDDGFIVTLEQYRFVFIMPVSDYIRGNYGT